MALKEMEDDVDEELDGARNYWNKYLETNDVQFKEMAHDELKHASILIKKHLVSADDSYSIVLPKIPMFAPKDCIIKIDSADIDKIVSYIQPFSVA